ncbi:MAG: phosphotransferase, partial [Caldilineaceae bacterium]|nr:phosphotransferase [Caldilineaceae bacterium]
MMTFSTADHDLLLHQLARCYGLASDQLQCLTDNPADGVYGFTRHGQAFVLKYSDPTVRSFATLQSQVHWLDFLATQGAPVSRPVPSPQGVLVEQLPLENALVSAVCYERVPGVRPAVPRLTAEQWQRWGETLGKLHALSMRYTPPLQQVPLTHWDAGVTQDRATIPAEQTHVLEKFDALQAYFQTLPTGPQLYGVIHGDCQANNLCLDHETFRVIDFDNCAYHWFLMDIATSLYFTLWERPTAQTNATFAAFVLENLWAGYTREYPLDGTWVERLPIFLKQIEMNTYVAILAYNQAA